MEHIQKLAPRCMLFANNIVLLGELEEDLNERFKTWRRVLETQGFRISRSKTEYMEWDVRHRIQAGWLK